MLILCAGGNARLLNAITGVQKGGHPVALRFEAVRELSFGMMRLLLTRRPSSR